MGYAIPGNIPETNELYIKRKLWTFIIAYLDDIIIYSYSIEEHEKHLEIILGKIKAAGLFLNAKKYKFSKSEVKFLDSIVSKGKIIPTPIRLKLNKNVSSLKQKGTFLGLSDYIREYIIGYAHILYYLTGMLKGKGLNSQIKLKWTKESENYLQH